MFMLQFLVLRFISSCVLIFIVVKIVKNISRNTSSFSKGDSRNNMHQQHMDMDDFIRQQQQVNKLHMDMHHQHMDMHQEQMEMDDMNNDMNNDMMNDMMNF